MRKKDKKEEGKGMKKKGKRGQQENGKKEETKRKEERKKRRKRVRRKENKKSKKEEKNKKIIFENKKFLNYKIKEKEEMGEKKEREREKEKKKRSKALPQSCRRLTLSGWDAVSQVPCTSCKNRARPIFSLALPYAPYFPPCGALRPNQLLHQRAHPITPGNARTKRASLTATVTRAST